MKGAYLLSKDPAFYEGFTKYLKQLGYHHHGEAKSSIKLTTDNNLYFLFYDRLAGGFFERYEIPLDARSQGYCYGFLVECRSEVLFCEIVSSSPPELDLLVCDSDGALYRPNEVSPESIVL